MAKARSRVLVIDASIAHAAGDISMHPTSRSCREFLQAVLDLGHRMAMTDPIQEEWNKHRSRFARRWRTSMMARKKIETVEVPAHLSLEKRIKLAVADKRLVAIIEKDRRLIEAALAADQRIASLDDMVRKHLQDHRSMLHEAALVCWVNPNNPAEGGYRLARVRSACGSVPDARLPAPSQRMTLIRKIIPTSLRIAVAASYVM